MMFASSFLGLSAWLVFTADRAGRDYTDSDFSYRFNENTIVHDESNRPRGARDASRKHSKSWKIYRVMDGLLVAFHRFDSEVNMFAMCRDTRASINYSGRNEIGT